MMAGLLLVSAVFDGGGWMMESSAVPFHTEKSCTQSQDLVLIERVVQITFLIYNNVLVKKFN